MENTIYTAGQIALDPASGQVVEGGIREQTVRVLENLRAVLRAAGTDLGRVVKTTVFLADMADFAEMNDIYAQAFGSHKPARSTVAVAGLPRGVRVEITWWRCGRREACLAPAAPTGAPGGRIGPGGPAGLQIRDGGALGDSGGFDSHTLPSCPPPCLPTPPPAVAAAGVRCPGWRRRPGPSSAP